MYMGSYLLYIVHVHKMYLRKIHFRCDIKNATYVSHILSDTVGFVRDMFAKGFLL